MIIFLSVLSFSAFSQKDSVFKKSDMYTGKTTFNTPFFQSYQFLKIKDPATSFTVLLLHAYSTYLSFDTKGVYLRFNDGSIYAMPEQEVKLDPDGTDDHLYYSYVNLSANDSLSKILQTKYIVSYKLDIFEQLLDYGQSEDDLKNQGYDSHTIYMFIAKRKEHEKVQKSLPKDIQDMFKNEHSMVSAAPRYYQLICAAN